MSQEIKYYTAEEVAESLGVNVASVHRWADSEKLEYSMIEDGCKKFSAGHLSEFAKKYNISMNFLDSASNRFIQTRNRSLTIAVAK